MNTEPLIKAAQGIAMLVDDLREANSAAIAANDQFAEIVLYAILEQTGDLKVKIDRALNAGINSD